MPSTTYYDATFGVRQIGARTDSAGTAVDDLPFEQDALINAVLTEGYLTTDAFVVAADSPASMDVIVGSGTAKADLYVVETDETGRHPYIVRLDDANDTITLDAADASNGRIDEIWLVVRDPGLSGDAGSLALPRLAYRKGDAGASPSAPGADSAWAASVKLATITVSAGVSSITAGNIADNRAAAELNAVLSGQFADVDGDTFTGAVTFEALGTFEDGIEGSIGSDQFGEGDAHGPSVYPDGLSWMELDGTRTWAPGNTGAAVYTFNFGDANKTWQLHVLGNPGDPSTLSFRSWLVASSSWGDWKTIVTAESPGTWEVDNSTEVAGDVALATSYASIASVTLDIPSDWGSWKCEAYATSAMRTGGGASATGRDRIRIDGTDQAEHVVGIDAGSYQAMAVGGRRTGMTTTGTRTIAYRAMADSIASSPQVSRVYLYARAVRTS